MVLQKFVNRIVGYYFARANLATEQGLIWLGVLYNWQHKNTSILGCWHSWKTYKISSFYLVGIPYHGWGSLCTSLYWWEHFFRSDQQLHQLGPRTHITMGGRRHAHVFTWGPWVRCKSHRRHGPMGGPQHAQKHITMDNSPTMQECSWSHHATREVDASIIGRHHVQMFKGSTNWVSNECMSKSASVILRRMTSRILINHTIFQGWQN